MEGKTKRLFSECAVGWWEEAYFCLALMGLIDSVAGQELLPTAELTALFVVFLWNAKERKLSNARIKGSTASRRWIFSSTFTFA